MMADSGSSIPSAPDGSASLLSASLSSARALMLLQLLSRLATFLLNQALLRLASPQVYGTAAIQFELLLSTILFLSREGIRNALLRAWPQKQEGSTRTVVPFELENLTLVPLFLGVPLAVASACIYFRVSSVDTRDQPYFASAIGIYAFSSVVELLSEPMHIRAMGEMGTGIRVRAEGLGVVGKSLATLLVLFMDSRMNGEREGRWGLLAFAAGQLAYASLVLGTYINEYGAVSYWPKQASPSLKNRGKSTNSWLASYFDPTLFWLSLAMTSQSVLKHFLTEGDKLIISWVSPLQDQGGYAVAVNYGSLVARIVFQPIEEISRVFFSKTLSVAPTTGSNKPGNGSPSREALSQAARTLLSLLAVQTHLTLILVALAPPYMPVVLRLLLPPRYLSTSAPGVLSAWIWYIPILAVNGGLEAFVSSVATPTDLARQSRYMAAFSAIYISSALGFHSVLHLGDTSLVYANIINLSARIAYCAYFTSAYFTGHRARDLLHWRYALPKWHTSLVVGLAGMACRYSARKLRVGAVMVERGRMGVVSVPVLTHIGLGAALGVACLAVWWFTAARFYTLPSRRAKAE